MKMVAVSKTAKSLNALLQQARRGSIILRAGDGSEYLLRAMDDFDQEVERTAGNEELTRFLSERSRKPGAISLREVKRRLHLEVDSHRRGKKTKQK